jgi:hypothetical protein
MSQIGAGRLAGSLIGEVKATVKARIGAAAAELVAEISDGTTAVEKALQREALDVRASFAEVVGNASAAAEEAVAKAEAAADNVQCWPSIVIS